MRGGQLVFFVIMIVLLLFMFSRTRKQQKSQQQVQGSVAPGAEVMTTSGTYGTVVAVEDDVVTLEIAPGVHTRWSRRAVTRVLTPSVAVEAEPGAEPGVHGLDLTKASQPGDVRSEGDVAGGSTRA